MSISVIIMGGTGHMGSILTKLADQAEDIELKAVLDREECLVSLSPLTAKGIIVSSNPEDAFAKIPSAVVIDFTAPEASMNNARIAATIGNPMIIGTTGFSEKQLNELEELAKNHILFRSANMSVGINVIMDILPKLTSLLGEAYDIEMTEIHHNRKKDAPSGTALLLAEPLLKARDLQKSDINRNRFDSRTPRKHDEIGIQSLRGGDVVGVHTIYYMGPGERIEIAHHAHSRENFANGALRAARWIVNQEPGRLYNMQDVLHS